MFSVLELYSILIPRDFSLSFPLCFLFSNGNMYPLATCLLPATPYEGTVPSIAVLLVFITLGDPSSHFSWLRHCPSWWKGLSIPVSGHVLK